MSVEKGIHIFLPKVESVAPFILSYHMISNYQTVSFFYYRLGIKESREEAVEWIHHDNWFHQEISVDQIGVIGKSSVNYCQYLDHKLEVIKIHLNGIGKKKKN